jgi:hypothetical protein
MIMGRRLARWAWILVFALAAAPVAAAPFRVSLEADAVVASGVTAKGKVALLGVTREIGPDDFPVVKRHLEVLEDDDGDGMIRYPVEQGIPVRSLWAVVDLTSGDSDTVSPAAFGTRRVNWRGHGLRRRGDGKDAVEDQRTLVELLVVRPAVGAWALRVSDGNGSDGDGRIDGRLEGIFEDMQPLAASPKPPSVFLRDDVVLVLDPALMEITLIKVPQNS